MMADLQQRWKDMHGRFFDGLIKQVKDMHDHRVVSRDVQEYMEMRRGTIGAYPAICLAEYVDRPSFLLIRNPQMMMI